MSAWRLQRQTGCVVVGVDVVTARDAGLLSATDENHLELAESEGRAIFTQDDDFLRLHAAGRPHYGIVYASKTTSIGDIVNGRMLVYNVLDDEEMRNHLEYL